MVFLTSFNQNLEQLFKICFTAFNLTAPFRDVTKACAPRSTSIVIAGLVLAVIPTYKLLTCALRPSRQQKHDQHAHINVKVRTPTQESTFDAPEVRRYHSKSSQEDARSWWSCASLLVSLTTRHHKH